MDPVKSAIYWYDKTIAEFPNAPAANHALKDINKGNVYFPVLKETPAHLDVNQV